MRIQPKYQQVILATPGWLLYELSVYRDVAWVEPRPIVAWLIEITPRTPGAGELPDDDFVMGDPLVAEDCPPVLVRYDAASNCTALCWTSPGEIPTMGWDEIMEEVGRIRMRKTVA